ncbi:unnamed protein product [Prunus armeniaca]
MGCPHRPRSKRPTNQDNGPESAEVRRRECSTGFSARSIVGCANLTAWCFGPKGCGLTRDVLLLDEVWLCASVPARSTVRRDGDEIWVEDGLNDAPVSSSTPDQTIVAERGTDLGRQVHGLSYKVV